MYLSSYHDICDISVMEYLVHTVATLAYPPVLTCVRELA